MRKRDLAKLKVIAAAIIRYQLFSQPSLDLVFRPAITAPLFF